MPPTSPLLPHLEKLAAALITALAMVFLFLAASRVTDPAWAATVAIVCAFGTSSFSISAQALWQHGAGQLFLSLFLYLVVASAGSERRLAWAGLALGAAAAARATNLLVGLPLAALLLVRHPRAGLRFGLLAAVPLALDAAEPYFAPVAWFGTPPSHAGLLADPAAGRPAGVSWWSRGCPSTRRSSSLLGMAPATGS
jgi:hypothetical protein